MSLAQGLQATNTYPEFPVTSKKEIFISLKKKREFSLERGFIFEGNLREYIKQIHHRFQFEFLQLFN